MMFSYFMNLFPFSQISIYLFIAGFLFGFLLFPCWFILNACFGSVAP